MPFLWQLKSWKQINTKLLHFIIINLDVPVIVEVVVELELVPSVRLDPALRVKVNGVQGRSGGFVGPCSFQPKSFSL